MDPSRMELDPDLTFLENFEKAALEDDSGQALEWLEREIYRHPERMSILTSIRLPSTPPKESE